ncbi:transposase IS3/IS911 family protein [Paenibacillus sp. FSL R5-192]|nr:transposase IS3/IS911 family protein [Paenibacillus sp. FSL R5-192]
MKRNKHSKEFKLQVIKEAIETGNKAKVAREIAIFRDLIKKKKPHLLTNLK